MMFTFGFDFYHVLITLVSLLIIAAVAAIFVKGILQWNRNNHAPRLTVPAVIVAKRTNVSRHHHAGSHNHSRTSTSYYVTFQFESGDRMELSVAGHEYGLLVEGDRGQLSFQGTRYQGFTRT